MSIIKNNAIDEVNEVNELIVLNDGIDAIDVIETSQSQAYEVNGKAVDAINFIQAACHPFKSVVVEACAGSGKTYLLVARMLRLLLNGAEPAELLAITFTRKAAQEMRERLMELLKELALTNTEGAKTILRDRGVEEAELPLLLSRAQLLYEKLLASPQGLSMDTFHSWFGRLIQLAPLASGVPHGFSLQESIGELQREAYGQLMQLISQDKNVEIKQALLYLYEEIGDSNTEKMLNVFLDKRAEWWACNQDQTHGTPLEWLQNLMGNDLEQDARLCVWSDEKLFERIQNIAQCLGKGTAINIKRATAIEKALSGGATVINFDLLANEFYGSTGNRKNNKTKLLVAAIEAWLGPNNEMAFDDECDAIAEQLKHLESRSKEKNVYQLNQALFQVGSTYIDCYQTLKTEQRVFDFADLEWHAYRLLNNPNFAAYLHGRLDTRYKHILLDEFQDTNPLQWSIVSSWLQAYGDDASRPTVFIVGDPKQSIYRFRRAEPRVFAAAQTMLQQLGASVLRTNQTRRNAIHIIEEINKAMEGNAIYKNQTSLEKKHGNVLRLPLIGLEGENAEDGDEEEAESASKIDASKTDASKTDKTDSTTFSVRNPFTTALEEEEDLRRYQEGLHVARALLQLKSQEETSFEWEEVMLLVRRRSYLSAYEKALREMGIPFQSSRRGGLLQSLEIADIIALLTFLMTPSDNRALAHILKSPMMGASDNDLICLAQRNESSWWKRLQTLANEPDCLMHLQRASNLLTTWMQYAYDLPVHDLLDKILQQGDLLARYAQCANATERAQILGNIRMFTELALNMDGGRYPSLPKFIAALNAFKQGNESESPDESNDGASANAIKFLTIHSAKGLEAKVVVLLDSNHSEPAKDHIGILYQWPLSEDTSYNASNNTSNNRLGNTPIEKLKHFSAFGKQDQRGAARQDLFKAEQIQAEQENWNLLYVAVTRAKEILILSGIASDKKNAKNGVIEKSWYSRFTHIEETELSAQHIIAASSEQSEIEMHLFTPPNLGLPELMQVDMVAPPTPEQIEGIALHTLMERLSNLPWPIQIPSEEVISAWLPCAPNLAGIIRKQATTILSQDKLVQFFNPELFLFARNEMDIMYQDQVLRLDRLVVMQNEVWVLDYKRQLLASEIIPYTAQLQMYCDAIKSVYRNKVIKAALILVDGTMIELEVNVADA